MDLRAQLSFSTELTADIILYILGTLSNWCELISTTHIMIWSDDRYPNTDSSVDFSCYTHQWPPKGCYLQQYGGKPTSSLVFKWPLLEEPISLFLERWQQCSALPFLRLYCTEMPDLRSIEWAVREFTRKSLVRRIMKHKSGWLIPE